MPEILVEETPLKEDSYSNCYGRTLDIPIIHIYRYTNPYS